MRARVLALTLGGALTCVAPPASAEPATVREASARGVVHVTVLGTATELERIRESIGPNDFDGAAARWSLRGRWNVDELLRSEPEPDTSVRCWIDVSEPGRARLYFADARRERFLLREVPLPDGLSDLGRETLGQVLQMSVTALAEDRRVGLTRSEAERLIAGQRAPERREPRAPVLTAAPDGAAATGLELRPFYAARLYSDETSVVHGPGVAVAWVTGAAAMGSSVSVSAAYELPREMSAGAVDLEWQTAALRGSIDLTRRFGRSETRGFARIGGGADVVHLEPRATRSDPALTVSSQRTSVELVMMAGLGACTRFTRRFGACAQLTGDFYPVRVHYDLRRLGETTRVFVPWRLRPGLALGLVLR